MKSSTQRRIRYSLAIMGISLGVTGGIVAAASGTPAVDPNAHTVISTPASTAPAAAKATVTEKVQQFYAHKTVTAPAKPKAHAATSKLIPKVASSVPSVTETSGATLQDETGTHPASGLVGSGATTADGPTLGPATPTPIDNGTIGGPILGSNH